MTTTRISTYNFQQSTLADAMTVQQRLSLTQQQISSGLRADSFKDLSNDITQYTALDTKLSKAGIYKNTNTIIETRLNSTTNAINQITELSVSLKSLIQLKRNDAIGNNLAFDDQLDSLWKSISSQMNSTMEGRYLFSGTRTDAQAVDGSVFPSTLEIGVPDTSYYTGSTEDITTRIDEGVELTYNVRADDPAFQKIVAAFATAKKGAADRDDTLLVKAFDILSEGVNRLIDVQTSVNADIVTLQQTRDRQTSLVTYWKGVVESLTRTDLVSASTQVAVDQSVLQAAFSAFAKINGLQLSDFLR